MEKDLVTKIDKAECDTEHFKELREIMDAGGCEELKVTRAFVYGTMVEKEKNVCVS